MDRPAPFNTTHTCRQGEWGHAGPCAACGASQDEGVLIFYQYPETSYAVRCRTCGALGPPAWKDEPAGHWGAIEWAIRYWNRLGEA